MAEKNQPVTVGRYNNVSESVTPGLPMTYASPIQAQLAGGQDRQAVVDATIRKNRRNDFQVVSIKFTATADAQVAVLGNANGMSTNANTAGTITFGNTGTPSLTVFNAAITSGGFRYGGIMVEVSAESTFSNSFTEIINDYDNNRTNNWNQVLDSGKNVYAQDPKTRILPIAGEFNGWWGVKVTLTTSGDWVKYTFYTTRIMRGW